ncbi:MAG: DinB family protein [Vicinamibacterales bacterium]
MSLNISQSLLPEFDHEVASTRKTLERVPEGNPDFRPHPKSMTMARLAGHVAEIPMWAVATLGQDELDMNPPGGPKMESYLMKSRADALATFDEHVRKARELLATTTDETMMRPWTLKSGGQTLMTMPRVAVMRSFVMNHLVHHRAQLGVYLRMNDVPVPSIYGPSADEGAM